MFGGVRVNDGGINFGFKGEIGFQRVSHCAGVEINQMTTSFRLVFNFRETTRVV